MIGPFEVYADAMVAVDLRQLAGVLAIAGIIGPRTAAKHSRSADRRPRHDYEAALEVP